MQALITQQQFLNTHDEVCDLLESSYIRFFQQLGLKLSIQSNFQPVTSADFIIFSGGGDINPKYMDYGHDTYIQNLRDDIEGQLFHFAHENELPILAICRGMQHVNCLLGGHISMLSSLKTPRTNGVDHAVRLSNNQNITVNHFHNYGIYQHDLAKNLNVVGLDTKNDVVEAYYAPKILGLQWHPERKFEDLKSQEISTALVQEFIKNKGILDESCYFGCRSWKTPK